MGGADARNLISGRNAPPHTKAPGLALSFLRWAGVPPATKELLEVRVAGCSFIWLCLPHIAFWVKSVERSGSAQ